MIFKYIFQSLDFLERGLVVLSFSLMVIFSFVNVILRALYTKFDFRPANILLNNIEWSEPFSRMMLLWITFIGASLLTNNNRHIKIDIFGQFMSPFFISIREIITSIACMIICLFMFKASIALIRMELLHGAGIILGIKSWIWHLIIPVGFILLLLRFGVNLVENTLNLRKINKL